MGKVGFGVIGTGIVGGAWHAHVYSSLPESELVAVCDLNEERAAAIASKYNVGSVYTDYKELLANPDIQAVSIATPDFAHREIAVAAAAAGKHILVEKPLATTVEDAEAIVNAANKAKVKLMVDFHNRTNAPFLNAKRSIEQGELGEPKYIYARLSNTKFVATEMLPWAAKSSGLWFLASHTMDMAHWLLDDEPRRVYAVSRSGVLQEMGVDVPDFHVAVVEFSNGAVVTLESSWILPKTAPNVFDMKFEVTGSKGMLQINTSDHRAMQMYTDEAPSLPDVFGITFDDSPRVRGFVLASIAQFVDAVVNDGPVVATGEDGLLVTRVLTAITESAKSGKPVAL